MSIFLPKPKPAGETPVVDFPEDGGIWCIRRDSVRMIWGNTAGQIADSCRVTHEICIETDWGETITFRCKTAESVRLALQGLSEAMESDCRYIRILYRNRDIDNIELVK